jgi:hypothetical protein
MRFDLDSATRRRRWISETKVNGNSVLRMIVISYLTEERHRGWVKRCLRPQTNFHVSNHGARSH